MASGDTRYRKSRGGNYSWNANDRDQSRRKYEAISSKGNILDYLLNLADGTLLEVYRTLNKVSRYGKYDWGRITENFSETEQSKLQLRLEEANRREIERRRLQNEKSAKSKTEQLEQEYFDNVQYTENLVGLIQSEFHESLVWKEIHDQQVGDYLEDPVSAYLDNSGWGEEVLTSDGIKIAFTLSLDVSNSMENNNVSQSAMDAYRKIYLGLKEMSTRYPDDIFLQGFIFSANEDGKGVRKITANPHQNRDAEYYLGEMEHFRNSSHIWFSGQDTWFYPLLQKILTWEKTIPNGCVHLDIVISDAVFEHPTDIKKCTEIQHNRRGSVQTVIANFLPVEEWLDSKLPAYCMQYHAKPSNVDGLLRNIISNFLAVFI